MRQVFKTGKRVPSAHALRLGLATGLVLAVLGSAATVQAASRSTAAIPAPTMSNCKEGLTPLSKTTGGSQTEDSHFQVFACDDLTGVAEAHFTLEELQSLYDPMTSFMGTHPLPDNEADGEDGRIDVYLLASNQVLTRAGPQCSKGCGLSAGDLGLTEEDAVNGTRSSAYVLIERSLTTSPIFKSVLAHEFFHVLQFAYTDWDDCDNFWFAEASATWAEWYFVPATAADPDTVYPWFEKQFQQNPGLSLIASKAGDEGAYGEFMWPLYMQQQAGAPSIASAWKAMSGKTGCSDLNAAINAELPFVDNFRGFAVENFDYQLINFATGVKSWPDGFKPDWPDWAKTAEHPAGAGSAPPFPEVMPKPSRPLPYRPGGSYPHSTTVAVNLPQLSAQYDLVGTGVDTNSIEFDFSHLSNLSDLDVSLIGAEGPGGELTNPGTWKLVQVKGDYAKVCLAADTTGGFGTVAEVPAEFYVILDNHDSGAPASITGSYTVTVRSTCATTLSGTVSVLANSTFSGGDGTQTTKQSDTLTVKLSSSPDGWQLASGSIWSAQYTETVTCGNGSATLNASGSGNMKPADFTLFAYDTAYKDAPWSTGEVLALERAEGSWSGGGEGCPTGTGSQGVGIVGGCPASQFGMAFQGFYASGETGVGFSCSDAIVMGETTDTFTISGTLITPHPFPCGLWVPANCVIGSTKP